LESVLSIDDVIFFHNGPYGAGYASIEYNLKVSHQGQHGFDIAAYTQTDSAGALGSTVPGAESDICNCLVSCSLHGSGTVVDTHIAGLLVVLALASTGTCLFTEPATDSSSTQTATVTGTEQSSSTVITTSTAEGQAATAGTGTSEGTGGPELDTTTAATSQEGGGNSPTSDENPATTAAQQRASQEQDETTVGIPPALETPGDRSGPKDIAITTAAAATLQQSEGGNNPTEDNFATTTAQEQISQRQDETTVETPAAVPTLGDRSGPKGIAMTTADTTWEGGGNNPIGDENPAMTTQQQQAEPCNKEPCSGQDATAARTTAAARTPGDDATPGKTTTRPDDVAGTGSTTRRTGASSTSRVSGASTIRSSTTPRPPVSTPHSAPLCLVENGVLMFIF